MMQKNRGGEAVGATLTASMVGGVIGALSLIALVPFGRAIAMQFGSAEVAALSAAGLLAIAALSGRNLALGIIVAALGVLASSIGLDNLTGAHRFTFGRLELWDGLNIAAVVAGIFVIPEMLRARNDMPTPAGALTIRLRNVLDGSLATFRHSWLTLRCAVLGIVIGFVPGLGASVVVWMAYGHASQTTPSAIPYGQGAVAGVIAPEAANNAKEGGALIPTLLFAVPGTSSMGILLGAFALIGIEVGPGMVARDSGFIQSMGWVVLLANLVAFPICIAVAPLLTRLAALHRGLVIPFALMASTTAALAISASVETLVQIVVFGILGLILVRLDWPRAPFVLGFVIGPILESALTRTVLAHGSDALVRPGVLIITGIALAALAFRYVRTRVRTQDEAPVPFWHPLFHLLIFGMFGTAIAFASGFPGQAWIVPTIAAGLGLVATGVTVLQPLQRATGLIAANTSITLLFGGFLILVALVGPPIAAMIFAVAAFTTIARIRLLWLPIVASGFGLFAWMLVDDTVGLGQPLTAIISQLSFF